MSICPLTIRGLPILLAMFAPDICDGTLFELGLTHFCAPMISDLMTIRGLTPLRSNDLSQVTYNMVSGLTNLERIWPSAHRADRLLRIN